MTSARRLHRTFTSGADSDRESFNGAFVMLPTYLASVSGASRWHTAGLTVQALGTPMRLRRRSPVPLT
jgi:hypothetical protein